MGRQFQRLLWKSGKMMLAWIRMVAGMQGRKTVTGFFFLGGRTVGTKPF